MFVIEVTPLVRGTHAGSLTYYSSVTYEVGVIVTIPLRNSNVQALVIDSKSVSKAKTALKAATFSLRKLEVQTNLVALPESIVNTAKLLKETYPATLGSIIYALLPPDIRTGARQYPATTCEPGEFDSTPSIYTGLKSDRFLIYKSRIREAFAHRGSVLFVVPNSASVSVAKELLSQGIEKRVITFSSIHTKKQTDKSYADFNDFSTAKLIITTPNFSLLERHDITTIIIDESGNNHYQARTRPYLDYRTVLKSYAKISGKLILLGDILPSTEDEVKRRTEKYNTHDEHSKRIQYASSFLVTAHKHKPSPEKFSLFTPVLEEMMNLSLSNKGRVYLYAARRGLAPLVTCYDCGYVFRCPDSGAPYTLFRKFKGDEEERWFLCGTSGRRLRAPDVCPHCGSWRLKEQGVGIQQVYDNTKKLFPKADILVLDHETASTHKKAEKIMETFYKSRNIILIGTNMALPYLNKPVDVTAITSYEALRSIPTWRAEEQTLATLLSLREKTLKDCIVQTRSEPDSLLKIATRGSIDQFYDEEIAVRQMLSYPPFAHFILLTYSGTSAQVEKTEGEIISLLAGYKNQSYSTPLPRPNMETHHTLIRVPDKDWPDSHLMENLSSLPPNVKIEINPARII